MNVRITAVMAAGIACSPFFAGFAVAQQLAPIERVRITDNELNCAQLYA